MRKFFVLFLVGIFLTGGFSICLAEEKPFELSTLKEAWNIDESSPTPSENPSTPKNYILYWTGNNGGEISTMQDICLQIPKKFGGSSSIELVNWHLYGGVTRYEGIFWLDESNFKIGPGYDFSSTGASWISFNCWGKQWLGPGYFMWLAQTKKGLSGDLSPDIAQVNYLNYQFQVFKGFTLGPY